MKKIKLPTKILYRPSDLKKLGLTIKDLWKIIKKENK